MELAATAKRAGVRSYVFASSCSVYGCAEEGAKQESPKLDRLAAYAKSKAMVEKELVPMPVKGEKLDQGALEGGGRHKEGATCLRVALRFLFPREFRLMESRTRNDVEEIEIDSKVTW